MTVQRRKKTEGTISVLKKDSPEVIRQVAIPRATYSGATANIGYSASMTKNLGDYENVKVNVSLNLPIAIPIPTELDAVLDQAFSYVTEWVDKHMEEVLAELAAAESDVSA